MNDVIALVGNPNSGKTSLFNCITGAHQRVGNWTGVTVELKEGKYKKDKQIKIVDLPGLYSFKSNANDETVAYNYLIKTPPKAIINVVDATNLERNLSLTIDLCLLKIPMVIAVNFSDKLKNKGLKIDLDKLSSLFGVPIVLVSAVKNFNIDKLIKTACDTNSLPVYPNLSKYNEPTLTQNKFAFLKENLRNVIHQKETIKQFPQTIDKVLLHKFFGIPIFFLIMLAVYFLSINVGSFFGEGIVNVIDVVKNKASVFLNDKKVSPWIVSLCCDAIISSIGGVLSFLPQILILFALMALIEESGYASRVAFLLDRFFRAFGLSGKSILPMIVSCGCTVTGIMATRTIEGESERKMTLFLSPFMPCGAKTAVFGWFSSVFFGGSALVATSMYFVGIACVGIFGTILRRFKAFKTKDRVFVMEIPELKLPSLKNVYFVLYEKVKEFFTKAGLIVFCVSVFLWLFKSVGFNGYVGERVEDSFLYALANAIKYVFYPLGFGTWQASVAVISGSFAKEAVVETLSLLCSDVNVAFSSKYSVYAFMTFILLSPPCTASLATAYKELNSKKQFAFMIVFQTCSAYLVALIINGIGLLVCRGIYLTLSLSIVILIILGVCFAIKRLKSSKCTMCSICKKGEKCQKEKRFTI